MYHIFQILDRRGWRVVDSEDVYVAISLGAGVTTFVASFVPRKPHCLVVALANSVETAGQLFVFWDFMWDASPIFPWINFQVQIALPAQIQPLMFPIENPMRGTIGLRARNTGAAAYITTARIQAFYIEALHEERQS